MISGERYKSCSLLKLTYCQSISSHILFLSSSCDKNDQHNSCDWPQLRLERYIEIFIKCILRYRNCMLRYMKCIETRKLYIEIYNVYLEISKMYIEIYEVHIEL